MPTTDQLSQLITLKHDVLEQLHELAEKQLEVIAAEDMDRLLGLLATKQPLLSTLERIERALDPFRQQDPEGRAWRSAEERRRCQLVAERANRLLAQLMALEQQGESLLSGRRNVVAAQLQQVAGALEARQAYALTPTEAASGGLDLMSEM